MKHTVITLVAALTPAPPNIAAAVAAILITLSTAKFSKIRQIHVQVEAMIFIHSRSIKRKYVVPIRLVVINRVTSVRNCLKTPFSGSFSANSRTNRKLMYTILHEG